jgi:hypothetical protein
MPEYELILIRDGERIREWTLEPDMDATDVAIFTTEIGAQIYQELRLDSPLDELRDMCPHDFEAQDKTPPDWRQ